MAVRLLIKRKLALVGSILPILTHDVGFEEVVQSAGGIIIYVLDGALATPMTNIKIMMLDWHPYISYLINMMSKRGDDVINYHPANVVSWDNLIEYYNGAYMVHSSFALSLRNGDIVRGALVMEDDNVLPEYLIEVDSYGTPYHVLMGYNVSFYNVTQYVAVTMN